MYAHIAPVVTAMGGLAPAWGAVAPGILAQLRVLYVKVAPTCGRALAAAGIPVSGHVVAVPGFPARGLVLLQMLAQA
jgi:hypothetical protein